MDFRVGSKPIGTSCPYSGLNYVTKKGGWGTDHMEDAANASVPAAGEDSSLPRLPSQ